MTRLDSTRGTVLVATVGFVDPSGSYRKLPIDVAPLGIAGLRERDFLAPDGSSIAFGQLVTDMDGAQLQDAVLSIAYPTGAFEITPALSFSGEVGFVVWSGPAMALADPGPIGDPMIDPVFIVGRRHTPNPSISP
jgi:hypothetical protein